MSKLMDICGLVNYNDKTREHDRTQSIYGSVMFDEIANYFEGIVRTYDEKKAFLVFGTFDEDEGLQMYSVNESMERPQEIVSFSSAVSKEETKSKQPKYVKFVTPEMKVIIQDGEIFRDVTNSEISMLQAKVNVMKQNCNLVQSKKSK